MQFKVIHLISDLLQDSLLSRFDLLFVLLDTVDPEGDRKIADHVVKVHMYRDPREADGAATAVSSGANELATRSSGPSSGDSAADGAAAPGNQETPIWDKGEGNVRGAPRLLSPEFVKKYIQVAKCMKPNLTEKACEMIGEEYSRLRSQDFDSTDMARTQVVTARALETLIRLATAHAKARLSKTVDSQDAEAAIELVQFAYFKKVLLAKDKKRRRADSEASDGGADDDGASEAEDEDGGAVVDQGTACGAESETDVSARKRAKTEGKTEAETGGSASEETEEISGEVYAKFKTALFAVFETSRAQQLQMELVKEKLSGFTAGQIMACIEKMSEENKVMLSSNILYLI